MFDFLVDKKQDTKNILILGSANGSGNLGDEAMFESLAYFFYSNFPNIDIVTDASSSSYIPPYPNIVKVIPAYGAKGVSKVVRTIEFISLSLFPKFTTKVMKYYISELDTYYEVINNCDYVIVSGAGAINSQFRGFGIYGWGAISLLAKALNKDIYFTGQGLGPFNNVFDKYATRKFLSLAEHIRCRDEKSYFFLKNSGIERCSFQMDDATFIPFLNAENFDNVRIKNNIAKKYVVLSIHDWYNENKIKLFTILSKLITQLMHKNIAIVLLGNKIRSEMNDIIFLSKFKETYFKDDDNIIVLKDPYDSSTSKSFISNAELLITTRYHPAIFAYEAKTPTIAIAYDKYYHQKFEGAFMFRKDKSWDILDYQSLSIDSLTKVVTRLHTSHD